MVCLTYHSLILSWGGKFWMSMIFRFAQISPINKDTSLISLIITSVVLCPCLHWTWNEIQVWGSVIVSADILALITVLRMCQGVWAISTDMQQIPDIAYRPICIGRNDYRYRYVGFADMGYIGRYFISADTDMPTLKNTLNSLINAPVAMTSPRGIHSSCRGHLHLPEAFYGMKIGQLLAEI